PAPPVIYTLSLHDALPIFTNALSRAVHWNTVILLCLTFATHAFSQDHRENQNHEGPLRWAGSVGLHPAGYVPMPLPQLAEEAFPDRKSTRLNSSHVKISYA